MIVSPEDRARFLAERRASAVERFDRDIAPTYDEAWGLLPPSHERWLRQLVADLPPGASVLDAACGTGRIWPLLLGAGCDVVGVDQSVGMLAVATSKQPGVATRCLALQDLADAADLHGRFDAVACVDAMEYIGPEDWPLVLNGLRLASRPGRLVYLTVERADRPLPPATDPRQVEGEDFDGGYHYYPDRDRVLGWLAEVGLDLVGEDEGDEYWHLLLRRRRT